MSNHFQQSNLSEQFKKAVSDGLVTGDFRQLNILVNDTVTEVISEAGRQVKNAGNTMEETTSGIYEKAREYQKQQQKRNGQYQKSSDSSVGLKSGYPTTNSTTLPAVKTKKIGQISSILYMVSGGIGMTVSIGLGIAAFVLFFINYNFSLPFWIAFGILFLISFLFIKKGSDSRKRLQRMKRYLELFKNNMYVNISDLADSTGKSTKYILKDVKKMLQLGFFPEGHLDKKETCLMLDDATYREYMRLEKERLAYELEQDKPTKSTSPTQDEQTVSKKATNHSEQTAANQELLTMMQEGKQYIRKLRELNDLIPGEVISEKLYRMEGLLKEIFNRLEDEPQQMPQLHKLMNYYLPTTIKLLQSYADFDDVSAPGQDIIKAKEEIEKTVDVINEAFAELLNKLFQTTVFDVTADAQVLQTMLAKEGLTKTDFSEKK